MSPKSFGSSDSQSNKSLCSHSGNNNSAEEEQDFFRVGGPERPDHIRFLLNILQALEIWCDQIILQSRVAQCIRNYKFKQHVIGDIVQQQLRSSASLESMNQVLPHQSPVCGGSNSPSIDEGPWHGMEQQHVNLPAARECVNDDSGFGSGGWGPEPLCEVDHNDFYKLKKNDENLEDSCIYFTGIDSPGARKILSDKPTGTFLVRDSSDPRYLYSLSVKTDRGATSVRILYRNGLFQFDSDERIREKLPRFDSVLSLVDFHVMITQEGHSRCWRWEERSGGKNIQVMLSKPLKSSVPSLAHLSRVKINQCLDNVHLPELSVDRLPSISEKCKRYLKEYPYRI